MKKPATGRERESEGDKTEIGDTTSLRRLESRMKRRECWYGIRKGDWRRKVTINQRIGRERNRKRETLFLESI